ncbi:hypothetical protein CTI14_19335 [Methylobacterium radiotolerans]|nr:hypothetical protein CTI14_19335 [Methylobacterium radiotolerans]
MKVGLVRHAHAEKNLKATVGGPGSALSTQGRQQADLLRHELNALLPGARIISVDRPQCIETASLLAAENQRQIELARLQPYGLGVIEGLAESEVLQRMPDVSARLEAWNRGEIDINELALPNAQDPLEYFRQGVEFLDGLAQGRQQADFSATN